MKMRFKVSILAVLSLALLREDARAMPQSCPPFLAAMSSATLQQVGETVCSIYDKYHELLENYVVENDMESEYYRLQNVWGPRFINYSDFFGDMGRRKDFDPWTIYSPAPTTWGSWQNASFHVIEKSNANIRNYLKDGSGLMPLSVQLIQEFHAAALNGLDRADGGIRTTAVVGQAYWRDKWPAPISAARQIIRYPDATNGEVLVRFKQTQCYEDMSPELRKLVDAKMASAIPEDTNATFRNAAGEEMACGVYFYPSAEVLGRQLTLLLAEVNVQTMGIYQNGAQGLDPVALAARAQRWLVSLHPFLDGNGRTTRLVMDYLLTSLGLPPPILRDMNLDTSITEAQWAVEVARGMKLYNILLERCLTDPGAQGCKLTPAKP